MHLRPVGPLPAAIYWRRRAAVLLAVLLVAALVAVPLGNAGDDGPAGDATGDRTADPSAGANETSAEATSDAAAADPTAPAGPDPSTVAPCPDDALEVTASSDAADHPVGARVRLTLTVRNTGAAACRRALGQGAVELIVTSGEDRIWSSDDCAPGGPQDEVVLEPGATRTARATWPTTRSAPGCPPDQPAAQPGTYQVSARVGELRVPGMVLRLAG